MPEVARIGQHPITTGPLAGEWTPARVLQLASASVIEPLCDTLNELGTLAEIDQELHRLARALFNGKGTRRDQREKMAGDINALRARLNTIQIAAGS